jgi:hypothetical protein
MLPRSARTIALLLVLMFVTSVAVRAHLGTVTAGSVSGITISATTISGSSISGTSISGSYIDGSTIEAGGGVVVLDDDGIVIDDGSMAVNGINWSGGGQVRGLAGSLFLSAPNGLSFDSQVFADTINMHTDQDLIMNGTGSDIVFNRSDFKSGNQYLCVNSSGVVFATPFPCA